MSRDAWRSVGFIAVVYLLTALAIMCGTYKPAFASEAYTAEEIHDLISAYSARYATPAAPYAWLVSRSERVASCETGGFDERVINNARRGRLGEVGTGQFHPRGLWWSTPQAAAGYSMFDPEANVAALVWGVSRGFGPSAWLGCW